MDGAHRQAAIVRGLQQRGRVEVADLAMDLDTSEVTVRRDLDDLAAAGVLRRVRGGAVSLLMRGQELPFAMRETEAGAAKEHVADTAAALIGDGEAVLLDGGSTALALAHRLRGRRLTVLALSLHAVGPLLADPQVTVLLPGGATRPGELTLSGPLAEASIAALRFDTAVLGCCGLSCATGLTAYEIADAAVKRAAMAASARTIVLADATKFSRTALALVCPATEVDVVVTDPDAPATEVRGLREAGVAVHGVG